MSNSKKNNPTPSDNSSRESFNRQLPPSQTSTPMPKVKPPAQKSGD
ncbi:MAG: hypothetical protein ABJH06_05325 [Paraglaciecola sp.]